MKIFPEIKKIAIDIDEIRRNIEKLEEKLGVDGLEYQEAYLLSGCREENGHLYKGGMQLDNCGLVDDSYYCSYYCEQHSYFEEGFHGTIYFKMDIPGQFVGVPYDVWEEYRGIYMNQGSMVQHRNQQVGRMRSNLPAGRRDGN